MPSVRTGYITADDQLWDVYPNTNYFSCCVDQKQHKKMTILNFDE